MYFQMNRETQKLELIFSKEEYQALSADQQSAIKSNFLFSRRISGWVSRAKFPHLYFAEKVARDLGAEDRGKVGEALTFGEQQERKAERAEARAERMDARAERAAAEGKRLQAPIDAMRGDIAFFTQPNISTSAGRAFTRRREKMWASYERGWESFKNSEYYSERAETARETAAGAKAPTDKGFCERRIAEAEKTIRAQNKNLESYKKYLEKLDRGETLTSWNGEPITRETVEGWIEDAEEIMENALSKAIYYREALEALGGIRFSRENIKVGYIVELAHHGREAVRVLATGPKNIKWEPLNSDIPFYLSASYGEIVRVIQAEEAKAEQHPYKVGDKFSIELYNPETRAYEKQEHEIVKATEKTVTIRNNVTGKTAARKPQKRKGVCYEGGYIWAVFVNDSYNSGYFKAPEPSTATA